MMPIEQGKSRDRVKAAVAVGALHALLAYALISGLAFQVAQQASESLKVFDVTEPTPPSPSPPEEPTAPEPSRASEPEGAAAPESKQAIVVPEPEVWFAIAPTLETAPAEGTSDVAGPGTGSGGEGAERGSGSAGSGTGGGGRGTRAQRISGAIVDSDYPHSALRSGAAGTVSVRYTVGTDGRVRGCMVTGSSGNAELDATTCRLIERRFRYSPAKDAEGRPITETVTKQYYWTPRVVD